MRFFVALLGMILVLPLVSALSLDVQTDDGFIYQDVLNYSITTENATNVTLSLLFYDVEVENETLLVNTSVNSSFTNLSEGIYSLIVEDDFNNSVVLEDIFIVTTLAIMFDTEFGCVDTTNIFANIFSSMPAELFVTVYNSNGSRVDNDGGSPDAKNHGGVTVSNLPADIYAVYGYAELANGTNASIGPKYVHINESFNITITEIDSRIYEDSTLITATTNIPAKELFVTVYNSNGSVVGTPTSTEDASSLTDLYVNLPDDIYTVQARAFLENGCPVLAKTQFEVDTIFDVFFSNNSIESGFYNVNTFFVNVQADRVAELFISVRDSNNVSVHNDAGSPDTMNHGGFSLTNLPDGNYTIYGYGFWNGEVAFTENRTVVINTTPLTLSNTSTTGTVGSGNTITSNFTSSRFPLNITFLTYSGTTVVNTSTIEVLNESYLPVNYTIPSGLSAGTYVVNMTVTDNFGNTNTTSLGSFTISPQTSPPGDTTTTITTTTPLRSLSISIDAECVDDEVVFTVRRMDINQLLNNVRIDIRNADNDLVETLSTSAGTARTTLDATGTYTAWFSNPGYSTTSRTFTLVNCETPVIQPVEEESEVIVEETTTATVPASGITGNIVRFLPGILGALIGLLLIIAIFLIVILAKKK